MSKEIYKHNEADCPFCGFKAVKLFLNLDGFVKGECPTCGAFLQRKAKINGMGTYYHYLAEFERLVANEK